MNTGIQIYSESSSNSILPTRNNKQKKGILNKIGRIGESLAAKHLTQQGYYVWHKNWTAPAGELDIISIQGKTLVFVEVKTRLIHSAENYDPFDAVDQEKMQHIIKTANSFIDSHAPQLKYRRITSYRFDIIGVILKPFFGKRLFKKESVIQYIDTFSANDL